eukprot:CAMPEP_0170490678 /NCGR_PEP_ID=MMETSP0208-20121228/8796_1 /TAXON_ID=197538 /ORGANISM="Strombidium inclinatum, Strain S3" /LENGTH=53 /DNA_ID=CAMNT_0010766119 /DNA_START=539 /DNA_END=700 /DNA_ORIENTATION=-
MGKDQLFAQANSSAKPSFMKRPKSNAAKLSRASNFSDGNLALAEKALRASSPM